MKTLPNSGLSPVGVPTSLISVLLALGAGGMFFINAPNTYASDASIATDASYLAQSSRGSLVLVNTESNGITSLVVHNIAPPAGERSDDTLGIDGVFNPGSGVINASGDNLAFETYSSDSKMFHLWILDRASRAKTAIADSANSMQPSFSPDGSRLVYRIFDGSVSQLFVRDVHAGTTTLLLSDNLEYEDPVISYNGANVVYRVHDAAQNTFSIIRYDVASQKKAHIFDGDAAQMPFTPSVSSDGLRGAFVVKDSRNTWWYSPVRRVVMFDSAIGTTTDVLKSYDLADTVSMSDDGRFLAYVISGSALATLWLNDTVTKQSIQIASSTNGILIHRNTLSDDGYKISYDSYGSESGSVRKVVFQRRNTLKDSLGGSDMLAPLTLGDNVLFLPGFEASRLYEVDRSTGAAARLWEPSGDASVSHLRMKGDGAGMFSNIEARGVIDKGYGMFGVYDVFFSKMDALKKDGLISDWTSFAYDWRLPVGDIVDHGSVMATLMQLASTSQTGKVTIVAHSEGGLIAKAILQRLGSDATKYVDRVILVGVPQVGAPEAVLGLLHGYDQGIPFTLSQSAARELGNNMPGAYALLPSAQYSSRITAPVIRINNSLSRWFNTYGGEITSGNALSTFLSDPYGKLAATSSITKLALDTSKPIALNSSLISQAQSLHDAIDSWTPPDGLQVIQVAGWGITSTPECLDYGASSLADPTLAVRTTHDGDGVVTAPSAMWIVATGTRNVWLDLQRYNTDHPRTTDRGLLPFTHSNMLDIPELAGFVGDVASGVSGNATSSYLLSSVPEDLGENKDIAVLTSGELSAISTAAGTDGADEQLIVDASSASTDTSVDATTSVSVDSSANGTQVLVPPTHALHLALFRAKSGLPVGDINVFLSSLNSASTTKWLFELASTTIQY